MMRATLVGPAPALLAAGVAVAAAGCWPGAASRPPRPAAPATPPARVYVAPGQYDEFYMFISGGFSGQVSVYGLPSGRLLQVIPVFSQDAGERLGLQRGDQADAEDQLRLRAVGRFPPPVAVEDRRR